MRFIINRHDYGIPDGASLVILSIFNKFQSLKILGHVAAVVC